MFAPSVTVLIDGIALSVSLKETKVTFAPTMQM